MKTLSADVPHRERLLAELRQDQEFALEYLKLAINSLGNDEKREAGLLAFSTLVDAYGERLPELLVRAGVSQHQLPFSLPSLT
jgi:hypothetical protein